MPAPGKELLYFHMFGSMNGDAVIGYLAVGQGSKLVLYFSSGASFRGQEPRAKISRHMAIVLSDPTRQAVITAILEYIILLKTEVYALKLVWCLVKYSKAVERTNKS